jgi:hypothetical protein
MAHPQYEILALRYATYQQRVAGNNFMFPDVHDAPMPIDYYVWAIRAPDGRAIVACARSRGCPTCYCATPASIRPRCATS